MKVACLIASLGLGGAEKQMVGLAVELNAAGHDVTVLTYRDGGFYSAKLKEKGIRYVRMHSGKDAGIISELSEYVRSSGTEILISFLVGANLKACIVKSRCPGLKLMVSERNFNLRMLPHDLLRFHLYDRWADRVICNNYSQETFIRRHFSRLSGRLVTIPNFTDPLFFADEKAPVGAGSVKRILVTARVCSRKNTLGLIKAVGRLHLRRQDFTVEWYGVGRDGGYVKRCRRLISSLGLEDVFRLHAAEENVLGLYRSSDIFCLPSFYEGTSNSLAEALACGLPAVCGGIGDNVRYICDGSNGFLFNPRDIAGMADAMDKALSLDGTRRAEFSARSRKVAEESFDVGKFRERYSALLASRKKIAAMTMVRGGESFIDKWIDYYGSQLGRDNIYVFFDGEDQYFPDDCNSRCRMTVYRHNQKNIVDGDRARARFLSRKADELFDSGYDMVIGTDVDEFIIPDPAYGKGLAAFLETLNPHTSVSALGIDVIRMPDESPLDKRAAFLGQRRCGYLSTRYTKCSIVSAKCVWGSGFHRVKRHSFHICKGLYLFHLGYCDSSVMEKIIGLDGGQPDKGWIRHRHRRVALLDKCSKKTPVDFDGRVGRIRIFQSVCRQIYAWNKPSMLGIKVVVRIPERFAGIV